MAYTLQFKRNNPSGGTKEDVLSALTTALEASSSAAEPMVGIYDGGVLFGIADGAGSGTIFDSADNTSAEIEEKINEAIVAIKGGTPNVAYDTIKEIADALVVINGTGEGSIDKAEQDAKDYADAQISAAVNALDVADSAVAKNFVTSVSEADGKISVKRGSVTSTGGSVVLTDNADGGINLEVVSTALTPYVGAEAIKVATDTSANTISLAINSGDKVLTQSADGLLANINLTWDTTNGLKLIGKGGTEIATIAASDFIKDGMLENVELKEASAGEPVGEETSGTFLVFTFNTDAGKEVINLNVTSLIDVYTAGNGINIAGKEVSIKCDASSEAFLTVGADGLKLSGVQTAINAAKTEVHNEVTAETQNRTTADKAISGVVDALIATVGAEADGAGLVGLTGVTGVSTVVAALNALAAKIANEGTDITGLEGRVDTLETEMDTAQSDITANTAAIEAEEAARTSADTTISGKVDSVQTELDRVETAVGLNSNGQYVAATGNVYTSAATNVADAVNKLDAQAKVNADAIAAEKSRAEAAEAELEASIEAVSGAVSGAVTSVVAGNGITVSGSGTEKTIAAKVNATDPIIGVDGNGIGVKADAVFDFGTYQ